MPAPTTPSLDDLLRVLNAATDRGTLRWTKTAEEETFRAELGAWMVRISKVPPSPGRYVLTLLDQDGCLLEDYQPSGEGEVIATEGLYKKVRRQALDLSWKLQGLYDHLKALAGES
jgi:hypothetical protein